MSNIDKQAQRKAKVITKEFVEEHLHYDGKDFFWKKREPSSFSDSRTCKVWNTRIAGKRAGGISAQGYVEIQIKGSRYKAHRLAWCLVHGDIPTDMQVDHINHDRTDNRIENLRLVDNQGNQKNSSIRKDNIGGCTGVTLKWSTKTGHRVRVFPVSIFRFVWG
ncbi:HNH endonuclease signature motif containing protein [Escherichia coli]|uniref:HNH endonuclease signature motif containing protein n=1 Tax=Escherichia coli TaxID=562 RepID=UPI001BC8B524|nr:HNH endonuclease signature motif containing protein [Escherichia coli]